MSTARTIIKNRIKAGNTVIGVGCYSAALTATDDSKVIKVGNSCTDPWLDYYYGVIAKNPDNCHFPKVYDIHVDNSNDYYVAVIEKLYKHDDREYGDMVGSDALEDCVTMACQGQFSDFESFENELYETANTCFGEFSPEQLYSACQSIREMVRDSWSDWGYCECEAEDEESCECGSEHLTLDLHTSNILYRADGTLVINDPLCDSDMEDVDDLSCWADENELCD